MYIVTILSNRTKTHMHNNMLCPYCQLRQNYIRTMHTVRGQNQFTYKLYAYCQRTKPIHIHTVRSKPIHIHTVCILSEDKTDSHTHCMHTVREDKTNSHTRCTHTVRTKAHLQIHRKHKLKKDKTPFKCTL